MVESAGQRANFAMAARVAGVKKVDEVAVGVAEQERAVAPGHRGGLLDEILDVAGQVLAYGQASLEFAAGRIARDGKRQA
jgi:hypothetical protein